MRRLAFLLPLLAFMLVVVGTATAMPAHAAAIADGTPRTCGSNETLGAETNRAGLVVTFGDGRTETFCIEFSSDAISGLDQLQRSGLPLVTSGSGGLGSGVCSIDGEGVNDPTNCFSECTGGSCQYWAYYRYTNGAWKFSQVGASQTTVHGGDIFGWSWGPGGNGGAPDAPGEIRPIPTSTPIPTATPAPPPPTATPEVAQATQVPPTPRPIYDAEPTTVGPSSSTSPNEPPLPPPPPAAEQPPSAPSPESAVQGAVRSPSTATSTPAGTPAVRTTASATPKSGAVVVGDQQGTQNQARSESRPADGGGSPLSLIAFGAIALVLIGGAGGIVYWRRRAL